MSDFEGYAILAVLVALWGIDIWQCRNKPRVKGLEERLGEMIVQQIHDVHDKARWLPPGSRYSCEVKSTVPMTEGRIIEIIVREVAA